MMAAMVGVLWAYDGWINVTPLAEEIRDPGRNIPRALMLGMATLIAVYLGMTLAYHYVLPMDDVAAANQEEGGIEKAVAAVYCRHLLGASRVVAISLLVMCSTFISLNGNALTGPRAYFAMARDGLLPRSFARVHPRFHTPANAVLAQGFWSILLTIAGTALIVVPPPTWPAARQDSSSVRSWAPGSSSTRPRSTICCYTYVIFGANRVLPAGDRQCVCAANQAARPASPVPHLGLSFHPAALRCRRGLAAGQHAGRSAEPRAGPGRHRSSFCWAFRPGHLAAAAAELMADYRGGVTCLYDTQLLGACLHASESGGRYRPEAVRGMPDVSGVILRWRPHW